MIHQQEIKGREESVMTILDDKLDKVIKQLMDLEVVEDKNFKEMDRVEAEKRGFFSRDFGMEHWDWPQGVGIFGLKNIGDQYDDYIKGWANQEINKGLPKVNINTTCPMMTLMDFEEYEDFSLEWLEKVIDELPRTTEEGFQHTTTGLTKDDLVLNNQQIWLDTIFMTVIFVMKMGVKYKRDDLINLAQYQLLLHIKYLVDKDSGLFYHGWEFDKKSNFGEIFWCRGNSWMTMGIPLLIKYSENIDEGTKKYFINVYKNQVDKLVSLRNKEEKLWHTVLDDDTSYLETSGSAGIIAGICIGISLGILERENYIDFCAESIEKLLEKIDDKGIVQDVSAGTAISSDITDYKNIIRRPMAYGQSMMICAISEFKKITKI